ncbi:MAG: efflux transporter outer membrane subunit [Gammaproteobacteria bacterium]
MTPDSATLVTVLMASCALGGCAVGPDYRAVEPAAPASFAAADGAGLGTGVPDAAWWQDFRDPALDALVERAAAANFDLRIAVANLRASRALLRGGRFGLLPSITVEGSAKRQKQSTAAGQPFVLDGDFYEAGLDASWELDFFGRVRRSVEALRADYGSEEAAYRDSLRSIVAEVARTYLDLRGTQHRLAVAERNTVNQEDTYQLTQALLEGGRGTDLDIARALAQLETTRASTRPLMAAEVEAINRLALLTGAAPADLRAQLGTRQDLPRPPELIAVDDPAALLRRRPDVRVAERQLAAATARTGVEVADYFPRVTLTGTGGWRGTSLSDLGRSQAEQYSVGPTISWAALDIGRVRARVAASDARTEAALANWEKAVLTALQETESALNRYSRSLEAAAGLRIAAEASGRAAELARLRYRNGADSFLTVLDAERRLLEAEDLQAGAETDASLAAVSVYKALGGGWERFAAPR